MGFATFAALLFRHAAAEDLARYTVADLHSIAEAPWGEAPEPRSGRAARRRDGTLEETRVTRWGRAKPSRPSESELTNDDKTFFPFGSLTNELHAQNLEIYLVVPRPILAVERTARAASSPSTVRRGRGRHRHESFVHVHVEPIDERKRPERPLANELMDVNVDGGGGESDGRPFADWPRRDAATPSCAAHRAPKTAKHAGRPVAQDVANEDPSPPRDVESRDFILTGMREYASRNPRRRELAGTDESWLRTSRPRHKVLRAGPAELVTIRAASPRVLKTAGPAGIIAKQVPTV